MSAVDPGLTDAAVAEAVQIVQRSRQTHVEWADYWRRHPNTCTATRCETVKATAGDLDHHLDFIAGYDKVLAVLRDVPALTQQARADALEDFAHNHVKNQTAGRIFEDLLEHAVAIRAGVAPIFQSWCDDCEQDIETRNEAEATGRRCPIDAEGGEL